MLHCEIPDHDREQISTLNVATWIGKKCVIVPACLRVGLRLTQRPQLRRYRYLELMPSPLDDDMRLDLTIEDRRRLVCIEDAIAEVEHVVGCGQAYPLDLDAPFFLQIQLLRGNLLIKYGLTR